MPFQQTLVTSLDLTAWASVPREIKVSNATITSIDNDPLTIVFDQQDKAPEEYTNELLTDEHFRWKGNVLILPNVNSELSAQTFSDTSWLADVKTTLSQMS